MKGSKLLFKNKDNEQECGWICAAQIGAAKTKEIHTECIIIRIPNLSLSGSITSTSTNDQPIDSTRKSRYIPINQNTSFPPSFSTIINNTILGDVKHLHLNGNYWEGWIRSHSVDDLNEFLWIYHHQTKTVYVKYSPVKLVAGKVKPLPNSHVAWTLDGDIKNKYYQRIGTMKFLCQRSKDRHPKKKKKNKAPLRGSIKTSECPRHDL